MVDLAENTNTARTWFQQKCDDSDTRHLWLKARLLCRFKRTMVTALHLFECDMSNRQREDSETLSQRGLWSPKVHKGIRILLDRIVTRWKPAHLSQSVRMKPSLSNSLTPEPLLYVQQTFDDSRNEFGYNIERAQELYEQSFVPLLYHELWESIKNDTKSKPSTVLFMTNGDIEIQITEYVPQTTKESYPSEPLVPTTLIFGLYSFQIDLSFNKTYPKLGLLDIVLINIDLQGKWHNFFAIVVHVCDNWPLDMDRLTDFNSIACNDDKHIVTVDANVTLYTSAECSQVINKHRQRLERPSISVAKLTNITSSRRQISAIYNLHKFPKHKSLLVPSATDPYFLHDGIQNMAVRPQENFNNAQMRVITFAERMFNNDRRNQLHLVHGPPGTGKSKTIAGIVARLLPGLDRNKKILLCAPSNNACDELSKRILHEIYSDYEEGTLVRVGREAPLDHDLCEHFLESLTMKELVEAMQNGELVTTERANSIKQNILNNAKIIVSTLNYSANNALVSIKKQETVKLVIIDEACQSLEADCLLPFYFGCSNIILVGDPKQLPPCVLSIAGQDYNLAQSLYTRLNDMVHPDNISPLNIQYRMHEEICHFPSAHFYADGLITDQIARNYWPEYPLEPYYLYNLIYTKHTCPPTGGSSHNKDERIFIKKFCIKLLERLVGRLPYVANDPEFIAMEERLVVITPYKKQMIKFRERSLEFPHHIEVMTVDSAQGTEKDIVLISCVRSGHGSIGFLNDQHRLNVMLTRAKRALYIFGNFTWLAEQDPGWNALVEDAANRQVIDTVRRENDNIDLPFL